MEDKKRQGQRKSQAGILYSVSAVSAAAASSDIPSWISFLGVFLNRQTGVCRAEVNKYTCLSSGAEIPALLSQNSDQC